MQKTDVNNTALAIVFLASAIVLVGGLVLVPLIEEAQAKKGEASRHISPEGRENQSIGGAVNSGVIPSCPWQTGCV